MLKYKRLTTVVTLIVMAAMMNFMVGCESSSVNEPEQISNNDEIVNEFDDFSYETDLEKVSSYNYNTDVRFHVDSLKENGLVKAEIDNWEAKGFKYAPEYSLVIQNKDFYEAVGDSMIAEVVVFALEYTEDFYQKAAYVTYSHFPDSTELGYVVQSQILSFENPNDIDFEEFEYQFEDGTSYSVWIRDYVPKFTKRSNIIMAQSPEWSLISWLKCTAAGTAATCTAAAIGCVVTGPAWPACAGAWCAGGAVGSAVGCAVAQLLE